MKKNLYIAEKPSVAREFAKALKLNTQNKDGYLESKEAVVTWCVGHLVTMSYPDKYDEKYKKWTLTTIPFLPVEYKYEIIQAVQKQYKIVETLLARDDISIIYVCTDSGREGEYIYRLVEKMAGPIHKVRKRVWIDSQTEDEILRGIKNAKDLSDYDNLSSAAFLRAKEDYLMGINFSRVLTLTYGQTLKDYLKLDRAVISVGRVMTCVLGMVVKREHEVRAFQKTPFYRILGEFVQNEKTFSAEWKAVEGSQYFEHPALYKENGFKEKEKAEKFIQFLIGEPKEVPKVFSVQFKKETKNPPLLYNLAELQNECAKLFKISPDETLKVVQELYEKKLVTYPRTDARVLSTAVAKEIHKNLQGLKHYSYVSKEVDDILSTQGEKKIIKSRYVNDKQITDHYAIIPTGQGVNGVNKLSIIASHIYEIIVRRFVSIFMPPAIYRKAILDILIKKEHFFANYRYLETEGFLALKSYSFQKKAESTKVDNLKEGESESGCDAEFMKVLKKLKTGDSFSCKEYTLKEGETSPPKRYNSGSMILAMENAGQLIEEEELRAQIKSNGIGTSATRAEILKKLVNIGYLSLHKKTQILTPTLMGECIYIVVDNSIKPLLDPALTASWEKGLDLVAKGEITEVEYMQKLDDFVGRRTNYVKTHNYRQGIRQLFDPVASNYKT